MQPGCDVALGADLRQPADQPLHRPEQHLHLHLGARAGLGQVTRHSRCGKREQQRRSLRILDVNRLRPKAFRLFGAHPLDQRVDVGVGRHVGGDHPQRRAVPGVVAIEPAVERQPLVVELGRRGDDGGPAVEQPADDRRGDRALGSARHHGDFLAVGARIRVLGAGRDAAVQRGVDLTTGGQGLALPPGGLGGHDMARALEPFGELHPLRVDVTLVAQPELDQVLARAGPPVVEQHGLLRLEHRRHQAWPVGAELGGHQVDQLSIGGRRQRR